MTSLATSISELAFRQHLEAGYNLDEWLAYLLADPDGYIVKFPGRLVMARDCGTFWFVHYAADASGGNALVLFLEMMPHYREQIAWARPLRGRPELAYYSTDRLIKHARHIKPDLVCKGRTL